MIIASIMNLIHEYTLHPYSKESTRVDSLDCYIKLLNVYSEHPVLIISSGNEPYSFLLNIYYYMKISIDNTISIKYNEHGDGNIFTEDSFNLSFDQYNIYVKMYNNPDERFQLQMLMNSDEYKYFSTMIDVVDFLYKIRNEGIS